MKRWRIIPLAVALIGALAATFCPRQPDEAIPTAEAEANAQRYPEVAVLRLIAKKRIANEAAAGRQSLTEAAALFGALNRLPPEAPALSRLDVYRNGWVLTDPVRTEDERLCRQVLQWVDALRIIGPPEFAAAAVARLMGEFREERRKHGAIRLPDPAGLPTAEELLAHIRATMTDAERKSFFSHRPGVRPVPPLGPEPARGQSLRTHNDDSSN
jgi:hypothetical protein